MGGWLTAEGPSRKGLRRIALLSCAISIALLQRADAQDLREIIITEFGTYTSTLQYKEPSETAATGFVNRVTNIRLVEQTDRICARIGLSFGLYYQVIGTPEGAPVDLQMVSRYPAPGVIDAKGRQHPISTFTSKSAIGSTSYRSFTFEYAWEMLAGEWVFEFHHKGRKVAEKKFTVATACGIS